MEWVLSLAMKRKHALIHGSWVSSCLLFIAKEKTYSIVTVAYYSHNYNQKISKSQTWKNSGYTYIRICSYEFFSFILPLCCLSPLQYFAVLSFSIYFIICHDTLQSVVPHTTPFSYIYICIKEGERE